MTVADTWTILEDAFHPEAAKTCEGLFTLGNGYMHVRGSLEELLQGEPQNRVVNLLDPEPDHPAEPLIKVGTYVPGLLGKLPTERRQIVNLPFFFDLVPQAGDERLDMRNSRTDRYVRSLDMRRAVLNREVDWRPRCGGQVKLCYTRFTSAAREHLAVQRLAIRSKEDIRLTILGGIYGEVTTGDWDLFSGLEFEPVGTKAVGCRLTTNRGETVQILAEMRCEGVAWRFERNGRVGRMAGDVTIPAGREVVIEKRVALTTSRDLDPTTPEEVLQAAAPLGYEQLLAEHAAIWDKRWGESDVQIEGDEASQRAIRHSLYHLHRALARKDNRVAICAKGYAGEHYRGLFFWDTEMCMLPFYLYTSPEDARNLCDYRIQALPGARRIAAKYHYAGARFPWMGDPEGDECCGPWMFRNLQIHITADVVYGLAHWAAACDAPEYLTGPAAETILETARYWLDRIDHRTSDSAPHLLGVMGPDEFTIMTSDNSYTNRLVRFALELAAKVGPAAGASKEEIERFRDVARRLPMPRREDGLVLQCEEFDRLSAIDLGALWKDRTIPFEWHEGVDRCKIIKQADVLMLMMLFRDEYTDEEVRAAWDYYLPLTMHASSLSPGVHAITAIRLGLMDVAEDYWRRTVELDFRPGHGGASDGIHIACCGVSWQVAVLGFAGMRTALQSDTFSLNPRLPASWKKLSFPVVWKGCPLYVQIAPGRTTITNRGRRDLVVVVAGERATVAAAQSRTFAGAKEAVS